MRTVKWNAFLSGLCGIAVALGVVAASAHADVTTEKGASILVFPKVRADSTFDTIIQITNTGNSMVHALCFYVNASLFSTVISTEPCTTPSATCQPLCQETDFTIWLTKQQPTHFLVSTGRSINPFDGFGADGSGFDPGAIPPEINFTGELKCVEVNEFGEPVIGNHLKGEATIKTISGVDIGDVSKYNAIGIQGNPDAQPSNPLILDGNVFDACPAKLIVNHFSSGSVDAVATDAGADSSSIDTELTLVPCSEDFENQIPTQVTVQFLIFNTFEEKFSASTTVNCFLNVTLTDIDSATRPSNSVFSNAILGSDAAVTDITPAPNVDGSVNAVIGVVEKTKTVTRGSVTRSARAANNVHTEGSLVGPTGPDKINLTNFEQQPQ